VKLVSFMMGGLYWKVACTL